LLSKDASKFFDFRRRKTLSVLRQALPVSDGRVGEFHAGRGLPQDGLCSCSFKPARTKPPGCRRIHLRWREGVQPKDKKPKLSALSAEFNTMKAVNKLAVLLSLGALMPFASAKTPERAYLDNCQKGPGIPVPVAVVTPSVSAEYAGSTVEIEFTVDTTGKPTALSVKSSPDATLGATVVDAVKQWRFTPANINGAPVATKVVLPVKIVDEPLAGNRYAAN
jgi:periplasmic protein TonB